MKKSVYIVCRQIIVMALAAMTPMCIWAQTYGDLFELYGNAGIRQMKLNQLVSEDMLCDSSYIYFSKGSVLNSDWILKEKAVYTYDEQGREVSTSIFDYDGKQWRSKQKIIHTYKEDQLNYSDEFAWDNQIGDWKPTKMFTYAYNHLGFVYEEKIYSYLSSKWYAVSKINYTFNSDFLVGTEAHYVWNSAINDWEPDKRTLYDYNDNKAVKTEVIQTWDRHTNEWINDRSQVFIFDEDDQLISSTNSEWDRSLGKWINSSSVFINYKITNSNSSVRDEEQNGKLNNLPVQLIDNKLDNVNTNQVVTSYWDDKIGMWEGHQKQVNFWTIHMKGNLQHAQKEISCKFSNPYLTGLPWYCESLKHDVLYTIKVYDLLGRCYYTDTFPGGAVFRIDKDLDSGFYIFEISGGMDKHSEKVYVEN